MQNITLGQYYPTDSFIHELDPRTKIISILMYIAGLFFINSFSGYITAVAFLILIILASKIPVKSIIDGFKPLVLVIVLTLGSNIFMTNGSIVLFQIGFIKVTQEGIVRTLFVGIRLLLLIIGSIMLTLTTKPIKLTDGLEKLLSPLKKVGLRTHEIALLFNLAIAFIPTFAEEIDKISKAQIARGANFSSGNLYTRAKNLLPLLIPLFVGTFRRASELAMAMEARCYSGGNNRTKMAELKLESKDFIASLLAASFLTLVILQSRGILF
ncbi:cobalt transport protein [Syntrophobotulus glycolicus DSM 8271]|uniref:Cobalt transport protein n=1 Tax=Syntrophobotulus glycolicus (strain DSM 8271 / FlGlyR) TaxID=645991 RepID=F0SVT1_SYNGF|nr:energy-coupling factor transporter transmembrane component T [Syntrophobotulus glycolicus]ADY55637.1 cobalt transport protein [Syntrophobotulus glycolicus DSM 8271]